ncbi:alginate biosynthesis sensor protein KinB [Geobacter sp. OR-1]|uniref:response regulator n=1 Tax=Geobacter sp. OR-1 TaxID=1266765 RepID=UPI000541CA38|nr:response regulator [Geobacter sp. OR-1]GAM08483.1 alginate biosynthesis sensor protein KinB [Geobacter sp. OR-1]
MKGDKILVVDDEADISLILKLQLEDAGYSSVRAHDGIDALECLSRERFDLMLLDIKMPRMNGIQVLERVRTEFPDLAVIMMTAHGNESIAVEAMKKGATDYIAKPFSSDDAVKKVERAIAFNRTQIENRKLQEELAREQQKVAAILEGMTDLLIAVDAGGRVMMVNRKAEEELALPRGEIIGRTLPELLKADIQPDLLPAMVALKTATPCHDVTYNLHLQDRIINTLSSAAPLKDKNDELLGSVEIIRDISTLRALEQEKEDFVSMLSHDLKSPITSIVGSLDLVREGRLGPVTKDQQEFLESAVDSCAEMTEMIDTLLDVHKFEAGKMKMAIKADDPNVLLQKALSRYQPIASRSQISLTLDFPGQLPQVPFDRVTMTRLLANLLSNAFKFTPEGGRIGITCKTLTSPATVVGRITKGLYREDELPKEGSFMMITVEDSGVGIPADALASIFDRFAQAQNRRKGKTRGTGLGLAFCRKVMDAHRGYIWAESEEGRGSTFGMLVPIS